MSFGVGRERDEESMEVEMEGETSFNWTFSSTTSVGDARETSERFEVGDRGRGDREPLSVTGWDDVGPREGADTHVRERPKVFGERTKQEAGGGDRGGTGKDQRKRLRFGEVQPQGLKSVTRGQCGVYAKGVSREVGHVGDG